MTTNKTLRTAPWLLAAVLGLLGLGTTQAAPPGNGDPEICDNGIDDDEDRKIDCADRDCRDDPACNDDGGGEGSFSYSVASVLPCPVGASPCRASDFDDSATRVAGAGDDGLGTTSCGEYTVMRALLWELDATGAVSSTTVLPYAPPADGREDARAQDVNDAGVVCGVAFWRFGDEPDGGSCSHRRKAVVWRQDSGGAWTIEDLPLISGAWQGAAEIITDAGWVLGRTWLDPDGDHVADVIEPTVWIPDVAAPGGYLVEFLPRPPDTIWDPARIPSRAFDMNDGGLVVGDLRLDGEIARQAVVWERTAPGSWSYTILDTLGGLDASAFGVNAQGEVAGRSDVGYTVGRGRKALEPIHATSWTQDPGSGTWFPPTDRGRIDGYTAEALEVDASGTLVGRSDVDRSLRRYGALWEPGQDPVRLDEQVDGDWTFLSVDDIAGDRWILTHGEQAGSGVTEWVVLVPTEP